MGNTNRYKVPSSGLSKPAKWINARLAGFDQETRPVANAAVKAVRVKVDACIGREIDHAAIEQAFGYLFVHRLKIHATEAVRKAQAHDASGNTAEAVLADSAKRAFILDTVSEFADMNRMYFNMFLESALGNSGTKKWAAPLADVVFENRKQELDRMADKALSQCMEFFSGTKELAGSDKAMTLRSLRDAIDGQTTALVRALRSILDDSEGDFLLHSKRN